MASGNRILFLTPLDEGAAFTSLREDGFILSFSQDPSVIETILLEDTPDLVALDLATLSPESQRPFVQRCKELQLPVLALVPQESRSSFDLTLAVEDFILRPLQDDELRARVRRILWRTGSWNSGQVIRVGDLVIDQERYEVSVAGRKAILTFKEYQLLCLLASNPGRVYSRETLLNRIWGYDFFGGTRTVDVHIRRVRSKIEDAHHLFIETVHNVGYRFQGV
ncbi:MAG: two-component system, OmpR family, alkaline phosphatase synthesis response regulator PhoP [Dehalococcoidia bacterium]|nr:two-component system, OmpR family, alkaline phosphatase synthesis response regulator PhoP [Dehalococcoidia bacterium]